MDLIQSVLAMIELDQKHGTEPPTHPITSCFNAP